MTEIYRHEKLPISKKEAINRLDKELDRKWKVIESLLTDAARTKDFKDIIELTGGTIYLINGEITFEPNEGK